jgi:hypothetical protein
MASCMSSRWARKPACTGRLCNSSDGCLIGQRHEVVHDRSLGAAEAKAALCKASECAATPARFQPIRAKHAHKEVVGCRSGAGGLFGDPLTRKLRRKGTPALTLALRLFFEPSLMR